jgi:hypothetical protein
MKKPIFSIISILLSFANLIVIFKINHEIAVRFLTSDGKTRALFGIVEIAQFTYKYYFIALSVLSILFIVYAIRIREIKTFNQIAIVLSLLSAASIFIPFWKLMI